MGHAAIENRTPFGAAALLAADEEGHPLIVSIIRATFHIEGSGTLPLAEKQLCPDFVGEHWGKPGESSCKYEPEVAFTKPATDVVLVGSAYTQRAGDTQVSVELVVGPVRKTVWVVGDRYWAKTLGVTFMSPPEPFESIPLIYERAFGGWDRSNADSEAHTFEPRNPVGTGFRSKYGKFEEGIRPPNLEDPRHLIRSYGDTPPPAGFAFTSPNWQPRASFAGTYDDAWMNERMPLLPKDFDRRFFNAASLGLVASGYLNGDEPVMIENTSPEGRIAFNLPGIPPPSCRVELKGAADVHLETKLDTVIINTDEKLLFLIWRAHTLLRNGPHDVVTVEVEGEGHPSSMAVG